MAKSRVLQVLESDNSQRKALKNILNQKGVTAYDAESLGSLVSKVTDANLKFEGKRYSRDPNLPDIDAMFDADELREVNGGQFKGCEYYICRLTNTNQVAIYDNNTNVVEGTRKIIVSDGTVYDIPNTTSSHSKTHTVAENGIYVGEDGFKYCVVKKYSEEILTTHSLYNYSKVSGIVEWIMARCVFASLASVQSITPAPTTTLYNYIRQDFPYNTKELLDTYATASTYSIAPAMRYLVINGLVALDSIDTNYNCEGLELNCEIYIPKQTATDYTITIGNANYAYGMTSILKYLKTPYSENKKAIIRCFIAPNEIYLTDNIKSVYSLNQNNIYNNKILNTIHFGSGMESIMSGTSTSSALFYNCYAIENITVSDGAFGDNTTATTIDLSYSPNITRQSFLNMANGFADRTGKTANILKLNAFTKTIVTDEEKALLTSKNWTIS